MATPNPDDPVAVYLRQRLDETDTSRASLATAAGVSRNTVTSWTRGIHKPRRAQAAAIATALDTTPEAVLTGVAPPRADVEPSGAPPAGATDAEAIVRRLAALDTDELGRAITAFANDFQAVLDEARAYVGDEA